MKPRNLTQAIDYFSKADTAETYVRNFTDPRHNQRSLKVGTPLQGSHLPWSKILPALWLVANNETVTIRGMARQIGITRRSARTLLGRLSILDAPDEAPGMLLSELLDDSTLQWLGRR